MPSAIWRARAPVLSHPPRAAIRRVEVERARNLSLAIFFDLREEALLLSSHQFQHLFSGEVTPEILVLLHLRGAVLISRVVLRAPMRRGPLVGRAERVDLDFRKSEAKTLHRSLDEYLVAALRPRSLHTADCAGYTRSEASPIRARHVAKGYIRSQTHALIV